MCDVGDSGRCGGEFGGMSLLSRCAGGIASLAVKRSESLIELLTMELSLLCVNTDASSLVALACCWRFPPPASANGAAIFRNKLEAASDSTDEMFDAVIVVGACVDLGVSK